MLPRNSNCFSNCCGKMCSNICYVLTSTKGIIFYYAGYTCKIFKGDLVQKHESAGATTLKTAWNGLVAYSTTYSAFSGLPNTTTAIALGSGSFALSVTAGVVYPLYTYKKFVDEDDKARKHKESLLKNWHQLCGEIEKAYHLLQKSKDKQEKTSVDIQKLLQANYNIPVLLNGLQDIMQGLNLSLQMMSQLQQIISEANAKDGFVKLITQQDAKVQQHHQVFDPRRVELENLKTLLAEIEGKVHLTNEGEHKQDILFQVQKIADYTSAFAQPLKKIPQQNPVNLDRKDDLALIESEEFDPSQSALQADPHHMRSTPINYTSALALGALSFPLNYLTSEALIVPLLQSWMGTSPPGIICTLGSEIILLGFLAFIKFQDKLWEDKQESANERTDENMSQLLNHTEVLKQSCERIKDSSNVMAEDVERMLKGINYFTSEVKDVQGKLETIFLYFKEIKDRIKELDKLLFKAHPAKLKSLQNTKEELLADIKIKADELETHLKKMQELFSEITKAITSLAESEVVMQQMRSDISTEKKVVEKEQDEVEKQYKQTVQTIKAKQAKRIQQPTLGQRICNFFRGCCRRKEPEEVTRISSASPISEVVVKIPGNLSYVEPISPTTPVLPLVSSGSLDRKDGDVIAPVVNSPSENKSSTAAVTTQLPLLTKSPTVVFTEPKKEPQRPATPELLPNQVPSAPKQNIVNGPTGLRKVSVVGGAHNKSKSSSSGSSDSTKSNAGRKGSKGRVRAIL